MNSSDPNFKKGFTLIETIVVILVFTLIMGAASGLVVMLYRTYGYTWEQSIAVDEARRGIETMVKEIREAREGENGAYPIEKAEDKEFIFYSDIDNDGKTERIRYFLGTVNSGELVRECSSSVKGGSCQVNFADFLKGTLKSAQLRISVDGDFGAANEFADIYADGTYLGRICETGCSDCLNSWQGTQTFNVLTLAADNSISFEARANSRVDPLCPYSMKAKFELSFTEELAGLAHEFRKGVIEPTGLPAEYPLDQEKISVITSYVRNVPPIFEYYDQNGNRIIDYPARLVDTKLMRIYLVVNVEPNRPPHDFELESSVQLRNLKEE